MNKNLFLKLGLLLLSLLLVSCGQKNNSSGENNSSKASTSQSVSSTQSLGEESVQTIYPSVENTVESKPEDDVQKNTQQYTQKDSNENELFTIAGGHNTVPEICEYYLDKLDVTQRIKPSIITENSSYYDVETDGNIYIDVILYVNNLSNEAKMANDLITTKIKINNKEYPCFSLVESIDESALEKDASIKPLEIRKIHYVAEVPIIDSTGELEIILTINGKNYSNKFNLEGVIS